MLYYINIMLITIVLFLIAKTNFKEGYINPINNPAVGIPRLPSDSACLILKLVSAPVDEMGTIINGCAYVSKLNEDNSDQCPA